MRHTSNSRSENYPRILPSAILISCGRKMDKQAKRLETKRDAEKDIVRHQMGLMAKRWQQNNTLVS